jgi:hypothetical protein
VIDGIFVGMAGQATVRHIVSDHDQYATVLRVSVLLNEISSLIDRFGGVSVLAAKYSAP